MSIQTYINKLADITIYRLQHLDRYTDHIYISKESLPSPTEGKKPIIYYENKTNTYELCDIMHSITQNYSEYSWLSMLLLYCPEHEPTRELRIIKLD